MTQSKNKLKTAFVFSGGASLGAVEAGALKAIVDWIKQHPGIKLVRMVLHSEEDYSMYKSALDNLMSD